MIAYNAVDHIPPDKRIITACLDVAKMQPQKMFDRATCRPYGFICGKHSKKIDDGIMIHSGCVLTLAPGTIYSSTATNLSSVYGRYVFDRVGEGQVCIS